MRAQAVAWSLGRLREGRDMALILVYEDQWVADDDDAGVTMAAAELPGPGPAAEWRLYAVAAGRE